MTTIKIAVGIEQTQRQQTDLLGLIAVGRNPSVFFCQYVTHTFCSLAEALDGFSPPCVRRWLQIYN